MPSPNTTQHPDRIPLTFTRSLVVAWLDAGKPEEIPTHLSEWINARVAKVLAHHGGSDVSDQDMATMGVASGLGTDQWTAQKLRRIAAPLSRDEQIALLDLAGLRTATGGQSGLRIVQAAIPRLCALGYAMFSSGRYCTTVPGQEHASMLLFADGLLCRIERTERALCKLLDCSPEELEVAFESGDAPRAMSAAIAGRRAIDKMFAARELEKQRILDTD